VKRRASLGAVVVIAAACSPIDDTTPSASPVNACPSHACAAYAPYDPGEQATCNAGLCEVAKQLDYTLVVSVPDTSFFAPNATFSIKSADLFANPSATCSQAGTATSTTPCATLPDVATVTEEYVVFPHVEETDVHYFLGNPGAQTALPVHATFRPLGTNGLPLLPVQAQVITVPESSLTGPAGGPVIGFQAVVAAGNYEETIIPDPPYDTAYPPEVVNVMVAAPGSPQPREDALENTDKLLPMTPQLYNGDPYFQIALHDTTPLDGGQAFLRDVSTKRRVSNIVTFGPNNRTTSPPLVYTLVLNTNHHPGTVIFNGKPTPDAVLGTELVVQPPPTGVGRPMLVIAEEANSLGPAITYPQPSSPVLVAGTVASSIDGASVKAEVVVTTTSVNVVSSGDQNLEPDLTYTARFTTDDNGTYSVMLPPPPAGVTYSAIVTPLDARFAKAALSLSVDTNVTEQAGKTLTVAPKNTMRGTALVADGRPLSGALVTASVAATSQAADSPDTWPRAAQTTTAADGTFALALDPGTYDLTIRPAEGSRLPWFVSTSRVMDATDVTLENFEIPAPIVASLVLEDPSQNPIQRAVVRAYAPAPATTSTTMGMPPPTPPFVQIGEAITDNLGHYDMYLAGEPR
jgi:hypothetical protein